MLAATIALVAALLPTTAAQAATTGSLDPAPGSTEAVGSTVRYNFVCTQGGDFRPDWTLVRDGWYVAGGFVDAGHQRDVPSPGLTSGTFEVDYAGREAGEYTLEVYCHTADRSRRTVTLAAPKTATSTTLTASTSAAPAGRPVSLTATVTEGATGTVTLRADGQTVQTLPVDAGTVVFTPTLQAATTYSAVYSGSTTHEQSTSPDVHVDLLTLQAPLEVALPVDAPVGTPVSPSPDGWSPADLAFTYAWEIDGVVVGHEPTYTPTPAQLGSQLTVRVTARGTDLPDTTVGSSTSTVVAGTIPSGQAQVVGATGGQVQAGTPLTVQPAAFPEGGRLTYSWTVDGVERSTAATFTPTAADLGSRVAVTVTVTAPGYHPGELWASLTVAPARPTVTVDATTSAFGGSAVVPVRVSGPAGGPVAAGEITLTLVPRHDGDPVVTEATPLLDGSVRVDVPDLAIGVYDVTAAYLPADGHLSRSVGPTGAYTAATGTGVVTVTPVEPQVSVSAGTIPVATPGTVTVTVSGEHRPTSYVLRAGSDVLAQGALASGETTITLPVLTPGTHHLVLDVPATATTSAVSRALVVTVAGEPARTGAVPTADLGSPEKATAPGQQMELVATGFAPGETVAFYLHSDPVLLGTAVADAEGVARLLVTLPADAPAGAHTVIATGGESGRWAALPVDLVAAATAPAAVPQAVPAAAAQPTTAPAALAATGASGGIAATAAWVLLLTGAGLVGLARRVRAAR